MPKVNKSRQSAPIAQTQLFLAESEPSKAFSIKKSHLIKKSKNRNANQKQECDEQLLECFISLISNVNTQFSKFAKVFACQSEKRSPLKQKEHKLPFDMPKLPTIKQCSIVAEEQEERIKKQKEDTQISSSGEKVW